jgi:hypothetical protein
MANQAGTTAFLAIAANIRTSSIKGLGVSPERNSKAGPILETRQSTGRARASATDMRALLSARKPINIGDAPAESAILCRLARHRRVTLA